MGAATNYFENKLLDSLRNISCAVATPFLKMHISDPGEDATNGAAGNTTRKAVTFGSGASGGTISNTVAITWTNVNTTETYSHVSLWDAETSGNPLYYGALTASKAVNAGDTFEIPIGDLDISID